MNSSKHLMHFLQYLTPVVIILLGGFLANYGCSKACDDCDEDEMMIAKPDPKEIEGLAILAKFGGKIDPKNLLNYADQQIPEYITWDNGKHNPITDEGSTLGRIMFYDKSLSIDNTKSCSSCHHQEFAFSDTADVSRGVEGGRTERHSMRLVNARFSAEIKFFWDERAESLEDQTTMPITDHAELGYSGKQGRPDLSDLIDDLEAIDYYQELFTMVYGSPEITKAKMQTALAQFVRSIQSFDSRYDEGYNSGFSNFSQSEKNGMALFTSDPIASAGSRQGGGLGCFNCHRPPAFDIKPSAGNNGEIRVFGKPGEIDIDNTKSPTLRDLVNYDGRLNGPMMHDASVRSLSQLVQTTTNLTFNEANTKIDLLYAGNSFKGNVSKKESDDLIAFLKTLAGHNVYVNEKWSDPFR